MCLEGGGGGSVQGQVRAYSPMLTRPIYGLTFSTLCVCGTLPCVDFMDVTIDNTVRPL